MAEPYKVEVIAAATGEVVKTLEAPTERAAVRLERGININMDLNNYYTVIVPPKDTP
jgi:hypothetical protein